MFRAISGLGLMGVEAKAGGGGVGGDDGLSSTMIVDGAAGYGL